MYEQVATQTGKSDTRRQQDIDTKVTECPAIGAISMAQSFVMTVLFLWTWGGHLNIGALKRIQMPMAWIP